MRSVALITLGFVAGLWTHSATTTSAQSRSPVTLTRIFTDSTGQTRFEQVAVPLQRSANTQDRGWLEGNSVPGAASIPVLRTSADYLSTFHSVATRRLIVMLSGRREFEVADGKKFVAGPGSIVLVEDVTGRGHQTRGLGDEAANLLIPLPEVK